MKPLLKIQRAIRIVFIVQTDADKQVFDHHMCLLLHLKIENTMEHILSCIIEQSNVPRKNSRRLLYSKKAMPHFLPKLLPCISTLLSLNASKSCQTNLKWHDNDTVTKENKLYKRHKEIIS